MTILSTTSNVPDTIITSAIDGNGAPVANAGSTLSTTIQIAFRGIGNNIAGFQRSIDGSKFSTCSSPFTVNKLQAGVQHNLKVRAVDSFAFMVYTHSKPSNKESDKSSKELEAKC